MLIGTAVSLALAFVFGLTPQACFESSRTILNVGVIVVLGFIAAIGFRVWADELLRDPTRPWYTRAGGGALLIASLVFMTGVGYFVIEHVLVTTATRYAPPPLACLFLFLASELAFVPLLDWPSAGSVPISPPQQAPPPPTHAPYTRPPIHCLTRAPSPPPAPKAKPRSRRHVSRRSRKSTPNRNGGATTPRDEGADAAEEGGAERRNRYLV
jgi:hypothetical protein